MPRNQNTFRVTFSDPLTMTDIERMRALEGLQEPSTAVRSVISPYHPANAQRDNHEGAHSSYTYRQRNLKLNFTLGWELEANHAPMIIPAGVEQISDGSVDDDGAEFIVLPAVTKSPRYVLGLLKDLVHTPKLNTNKSCGFHVHVSASNLASIARMRQWAIATEHLALQVEDLAFKAVPDARQGNSYCRRIVPISSGTSFSSYKYDNSRRYHWLNIVEMFRPNGIRTIEVRLLGNTHRWKYLLAWALFSMELARRGWEVSNRPFDVAGHVDALGDMLQKIAKEVKPLEKRNDPIPQWVYDGLKTFGMEPTAWERPLGRLSEAEAEIKGLPKRIYSDSQPELPSRRNEDDEDNSCGCGCGEDGACIDYMHDNGDCDSSYCHRCHEDGNCAGLPSCDLCIDRAHDEGESCERSRCSTCHPIRRVTPPATSGVTTGRVTTASGPVTATEANIPLNSVLHLNTMDAMQTELNAIRNATTDNQALQMTAYHMMRGAALYGEGIASVHYDESANVGTGIQSTEIDGRVWITQTLDPATFFNVPSITQMLTEAAENQAAEMLDQHEHALSVDREFTRGRQ